MSPMVHVVTGAIGYSGRYIARRLLAAGVHVRTLTNPVDRANSFACAVEVHPFDFENPAALQRSLEGGSARNPTRMRVSN